MFIDNVERLLLYFDARETELSQVKMTLINNIDGIDKRICVSDYSDGFKKG